MRSRFAPTPTSAEDDEPTPEPRSAVVQAGSAHEIPEHLRSHPFVAYMMDPPAEDIANFDALMEAGELYGDDHDHERELADLLAGRHPLQRKSSA